MGNEKRRNIANVNVPEANGNVAPPAPATRVACVREGLAVTLTAGGGKAFQVGEVVDLDDDAVQGLTWRTAIGDHLTEFFVPVDGVGA